MLQNTQIMHYVSKKIIQKDSVNNYPIYICIAYEYVPDAEIASVTIGTSLAMGQSGSEEDLLTEKVIYWRSIYDADYGS
jgi:hypothetical protein